MESKKSALIDTNISLDKALVRKDFFEDADRVFFLAEHGYFTAYISASSVTDIFYMLHHALHSKEEAMKRLEHLLSMATIAPVDDADIRRAVSLHWPDFEDAVQFTAAESAHADTSSPATPKTTNWPRREKPSRRPSL
jgi:hypothetical protein